MLPGKGSLSSNLIEVFPSKQSQGGSNDSNVQLTITAHSNCYAFLRNKNRQLATHSQQISIESLLLACSTGIGFGSLAGSCIAGSWCMVDTESSAGWNGERNPAKDIRSVEYLRM
jgi:hypothetical protein